MSLMTSVGMRAAKFTVAALAALAMATVPKPAAAGISYSTMSSLYTEGFDSMPLDAPSGANIESVYSDGWQDDVDWTTSAEDDVSVLGWHLFHPTSQGEGGFTGNQRFRMGTGNPTTGSFYGFGSGGSAPEKALGMLNASTLTAEGSSAYIGLQLINNTGQTLNRFTLTFDGEQWRDGAGGVETLSFGFSTTSNDGSWSSPSALFTAVPSLDFTAPLTANDGTGNVGNTTGKVADITATVTNFTWAPGAELWLRWADLQIAGDDDGLALDNVRFTADNLGTGANNNIVSVQTGLASTPATWSNNQAPSMANTYAVQSGHTVTVDGAFAGSLLTATAGGTVNFNDGGNNAPIGLLVIQDGGNLTETASGNFILGNPTTTAVPLGVLELQGDVSLNVGAGETLVLGLAVTGAGDMDLNTAAGSVVRLADSEDHLGAIRFNGSGDLFTLEWNRDFGTVEMNSTGQNRFEFLHQGQIDVGTLIFNEPGTVSHATQVTSPTSRLVAADQLVVNADVTVDLSASYVTGNANSERRLQFQNALTGDGDLNIVGMASSPANVNTGVGLHEFEIGSSGEPSNIASDPYSGTLTVSDYVNAEIRHSLPAAKVVINANARFEMGHDVQATTKFTNFGEIVVNSGGSLEIGHEDNLTSTTGHQVGNLRLVATDGQSGDLTLNAGSKTIMQVNGTAPGQFDRIVAEGDIVLGGVLELWYNPGSTEGTNPTYTPVLNDEFVIMTLAAGTSPPADFNNSTVVEGGDLTVWEGAFGTTANGDADGDGDSDGADFLTWQRTLGDAGSTGSITGNFTDVVAPTEAGAAWPAGLDFITQVVGNNVILKVTGVPSIQAVPEPSTVALCGIAALGMLAVRRQRANT